MQADGDLGRILFINVFTASLYVQVFATDGVLCVDCKNFVFCTNDYEGWRLRMIHLILETLYYLCVWRR